jgi:hypothetical protein
MQYISCSVPLQTVVTVADWNCDEALLSSAAHLLAGQDEKRRFGLMLN